MTNTVNLTTADSVLASVMHKYDKTVDHADANQLSLGYIHNLSARTNLYSSWARLTNGYSAAYKVSANGKADNLFNIGIRHKF